MFRGPLATLYLIVRARRKSVGSVRKARMRPSRNKKKIQHTYEKKTLYCGAVLADCGTKKKKEKRKDHFFRFVIPITKSIPY